MKHFTIDDENNVTSHETVELAQKACEGHPETVRYFGSEPELAQICSDWSGASLVEFWNSLPGVIPVQKFQSNATAVRRIFAKLVGDTEPAEETAETANVREQSRKAAARVSKAKDAGKKQPKAAKAAKERKPRGTKGDKPVAREGSKKAKVIELLKRANGATLDEIVKKMDWAPHTTRAFLSAGGSLAKAGITVESFKTEKGDRAYKIA